MLFIVVIPTFQGNYEEGETAEVFSGGITADGQCISEEKSELIKKDVYD